jgi:NAD(P)-dependent dehydrogenase (short-subunit alcohol dehydrogenase family)
MLIKRWGEPEDLVGPTVFLLSNASSYITGSDVVVDGYLAVFKIIYKKLYRRVGCL